MSKNNLSDKNQVTDDQYIKITLTPDHELVPDLYDKLPGKSILVPCKKSFIEIFSKKKNLSDYFGTRVHQTRDLSHKIEALLRKKILNNVSMAKKSGKLAIGLDSIKAYCLTKRHCLIIVAKKSKSLKNSHFLLSENILCYENLLEQSELEKISRKNNVKYIGILSKTFKKTIQVDLNKLKGFIENH